MPTPQYTTEDQLVTDLCAYWTATLPSGVTAATPVAHFRTNDLLTLPGIIVGHDGFEREKAKGMEATGRVALRVVYRSDYDVTDDNTHRAEAAAIDRAVQAMTTKPGPLALTYIHAILRESPDTQVVDRRQITVLRYQVVATRMEPGA